MGEQSQGDVERRVDAMDAGEDHLPGAEGNNCGKSCSLCRRVA